MLLKLLRSTPRDQVESTVISLTSGGALAPEFRSAGFETLELGWTGSRSALGGLLQLRKLIRSFHPDLVQSWMYHADLAASLATAGTGIPVVWGIRQGELQLAERTRSSLRMRGICAKISRWSPVRIVCCSRESAVFHARLGYAAKRIVVIPNGFDLELFRPSAEARLKVRRQLGVGDAPLIGMFARWDPHKDHETFLRAARQIVARLPDARFVLAGDGITNSNRHLMDMVDREGIRASVAILGLRTDVHELLASLDLFCLSSFGEGFPNVVGEAMACGVPAIVTDVGDSAWIVGDTGVVIAPGDAGALATGAIRLLEADAERRRMGREARLRVQREFDLVEVARRFVELQKDVASHEGGGPS